MPADPQIKVLIHCENHSLVVPILIWFNSEVTRCMDAKFKINSLAKRFPRFNLGHIYDVSMFVQSDALHLLLTLPWWVFYMLNLHEKGLLLFNFFVIVARVIMLWLVPAILFVEYLNPNSWLVQALQIKNNISRFSGFVWHENEVKENIWILFPSCSRGRWLNFWRVKATILGTFFYFFHCLSNDSHIIFYRTSKR